MACVSPDLDKVHPDFKVTEKHPLPALAKNSRNWLCQTRAVAFKGLRAALAAQASGVRFRPRPALPKSARRQPSLP